MTIVTEDAAAGIRRRYAEAREKKKIAERTVEAGRDFVRAYVEYVHYVEGLHQRAQAIGTHGAEDHESIPAKNQESASQHRH